MSGVFLLGCAIAALAAFAAIAMAPGLLAFAARRRRIARRLAWPS